MSDSIQRSLGRIEANQESMKREMLEKFELGHARFDKIESYLEKDKKEKYMKKGAAITWGVIGGAFIGVLGIIADVFIRS